VPDIALTLRGQGLGADTPELRRLPPATLTAEARLRGQSIEGRANLVAGPAIRLEATLRLPTPDALSASLNGEINAGTVADTFLAGGADRVSGRVSLALRAEGSLAAPTLSGSATLRNLNYANSETGLRVDAINGRIAAAGDRLTLQGVSGPHAGWRHHRARRQHRAPGGESAGGPQPDRPPRHLRQSRPRPRRLQRGSHLARRAARGRPLRRNRCRGRRRADRCPTACPTPSPCWFRSERWAARRRAARARARPPPEARRRPPPSTWRSRCGSTCRGGSTCAGRGLEAELRGRLELTGTLAEPQVSGDLRTQRGTFDILGKRLELTRGILRFDRGGVVPSLDVLASTRAGSYTVSIGLTGPANAPEVALSSSPDLPQDEVLSRLLFDRRPAASRPSRSSRSLRRSASSRASSRRAAGWTGCSAACGASWASTG
jgi:translocation and assembly module TamB